MKNNSEGDYTSYLKRARRQLDLYSFRSYVGDIFEHINKTPFIFGEHHEKIINALEDVINGKVRKLIINIAPRYGKTELAVKLFISWCFAKNPCSKFIHLSYSSTLVNENSETIKSIIKSDYYRMLFPYVQIAQNRDRQQLWETTEGGGLYAVTTLGQITGFGAGKTDTYEEYSNIDEFTDAYNAYRFSGAIVIDDPIKPEDALSENVREAVNRRFETTIRTRVNSRKTPIIIIMQRLHEHDLCGYLQEVEPNEWTSLVIPALVEDNNHKEKALWSFKHTLDELYKLREINPFVFDSQYMQDPKPIEGLLFPEKETKYFDIIPTEPDFVFIQVDPADVGDDHYCSKVYYVKDGDVYNVDTMYTKDSAELTVPRQLEQIKKWMPSYVNIESNSAWRLMAKAIREKVEEANLDVQVMRFNATTNKEVRIFNEAPSIRGKFFYLSPSLQSREYALCMRERHSYMKMLKNQPDDGVDTDAAASFFLKKNGLMEKI